MTDELKKAFETAKTEEEKKTVLAQHKDEIKNLNDEELERVSGGGSKHSWLYENCKPKK